MFERAINGLDMATGKIKPGPEYETRGPRESTYREGNSTVQTKDIPIDAVYNTTTNVPDLPANGTKATSRKMRRRFAPTWPLQFL
jgi:hypothetical protein